MVRNEYKPPRIYAGNFIKINNSNEWRFYLNARRMKRLMKYVMKHGYMYGKTEAIQPVTKDGYKPPEGIGEINEVN